MEEREEKIMRFVKQAKDEIFSTGKADISPLLKYIEQELSKAREEVLQRVLILEDADVNQEGEMTGLGTIHIDAILYEFEQDMKCWKSYLN
jgi:hypothetical protein